MVLLVSVLAVHSMVVCSRALYGSNLYLELVWLLAPTVVVVLLIARTVSMQCSDEELSFTSSTCSILPWCMSLLAVSTSTIGGMLLLWHYRIL